MRRRTGGKEAEVEEIIKRIGKYNCPAPYCYLNKRGLCCVDCKGGDKCDDACMNHPSTCGAYKS
jgi:hypothetical protein